MESDYGWVSREKSVYSFNSLQTGKFMERLQQVADAVYAGIESFNSLQTGKFMERTPPMRYPAAKDPVSIPFKRESSWKVDEIYERNDPDNYISIPFKRESSWKGEAHRGISPTYFNFNSLQTGKFMESAVPSADPASANTHFNSLQTGKFMERIGDFIMARKYTDTISIPFKRESSWKVYPPLCAKRHDANFNSLQTGKFMERSIYEVQS